MQLLNNLFRVGRNKKNTDIVCYILTSLVSVFGKIKAGGNKIVSSAFLGLRWADLT